MGRGAPAVPAAGGITWPDHPLLGPGPLRLRRIDPRLGRGEGKAAFPARRARPCSVRAFSRLSRGGPRGSGIRKAWLRPALNNWQAHSVAVDITNANGEWVVYTENWHSGCR